MINTSERSWDGHSNLDKLFGHFADDNMVRLANNGIDKMNVQKGL